jgi:hypothetical protein
MYPNPCRGFPSYPRTPHVCLWPFPHKSHYPAPSPKYRRILIPHALRLLDDTALHQPGVNSHARKVQRCINQGTWDPGPLLLPSNPTRVRCLRMFLLTSHVLKRLLAGRPFRSVPTSAGPWSSLPSAPSWGKPPWAEWSSLRRAVLEKA